MKNIITIICLIFALGSNAQENFFPGDNPEILIGKKVKGREGLKFYHGFYKDKNIHKSLTYGNDFEELQGQVFTVTGVNTKVTYKKVLVLENDKIGTVYYAYDKGDARDYDLVNVDNLNLPADYYCSKVKPKKEAGREGDFDVPFNSEYSLWTSGSRITIGFNTYDDNVHVADNADGEILLSDGTKIKLSFRSFYRSNPKKKGWDYTVYYEPTPEDIIRLKTKAIVSFYLFNKNRDVSPGGAYAIQEYLKCLAK